MSPSGLDSTPHYLLPPDPVPTLLQAKPPDLRPNNHHQKASVRPRRQESAGAVAPKLSPRRTTLPSLAGNTRPSCAPLTDLRRRSSFPPKVPGAANRTWGYHGITNLSFHPKGPPEPPNPPPSGLNDGPCAAHGNPGLLRNSYPQRHKKVAPALAQSLQPFIKARLWASPHAAEGEAVGYHTTKAAHHPTDSSHQGATLLPPTP